MLVAILTTACSSEEKMHPVTGKVLFNDKPAVGAIVSFFPEGQGGLNVNPSVGTVQGDGSFTLNTMGKAGAPEGKYVVTIIWPDAVVEKRGKMSEGMIGGMGDSGEGGKDRLAGRYANRENSQLKAEVKAGENTLSPFQIK